MQGLSVIVLDGGRSSRFGEDKLLYNYRGKPILEWVLDAARGSSPDEILLSLKDEEEHRAALARKYGALLVFDRIRESSPLIGMCAGAEKARNDILVVISGDSPLVGSSFIASLRTALEEINTEAAVPVWPDGRVEVIHAAYRKRPLMSACKRMLSSADLEVKRVLMYMGSTYLVPVATLDKRSLLDVDTKDDLIALTDLLP